MVPSGRQPARPNLSSERGCMECRGRGRFSFVCRAREVDNYLLAGTNRHNAGLVSGLLVLAPTSPNLVGVLEPWLKSRRGEDALPARILRGLTLNPKLGVGIRNYHHNLRLVVGCWKIPIGTLVSISGKWAERDLGGNKRSANSRSN